MRRHSLRLKIVLIAGVVTTLPAVAISQDQLASIASARAHGGVQREHARPESLAQITITIADMPLDDAVRAIAKRARVQVMFTSSLLPKKKVTYEGKKVTVQDALEAVLHGTNVTVRKVRRSEFQLIPGNPAKSAEQGTIVGKVINASTGKPLANVTVVLDDGSMRVVTGQDGTFRVSASTGRHALHVRGVGFSRETIHVTVTAGESVATEIKLQPAANVLDQIVVTGTMTSTELRAVPNAITVITADEIEKRGIVRIDELFRGDVPGLFAPNQGSASPTDQVVMFSRGATAMSPNSDGLSTRELPGYATRTFLTNPIKTYIDGVEMADPSYLSQIDPKSIERIEILAGPQASTIYGSNAINGVMQIFTKRGSGSARPRLTLGVMMGWIQNNFSAARAPSHDYSATIDGSEGRLSYSGGASWRYTSPWTPTKQTESYSGFGGMRLEQGPLSVDGQVQLSHSLFNRRPEMIEQRLYNYVVNGWVHPSYAGAPKTSWRSIVQNRTLGMTLRYAPFTWLSSEFGIGTNQVKHDGMQTAPSYQTPTDTAQAIQFTEQSNRSLRWVSTAHGYVQPSMRVQFTLGADGTEERMFSTNQSMSQADAAVARQRRHGAGGFLQGQLAFWDQLYLTYGLRAEYSRRFGDEVNPNLAPRYGVAYTRDIGDVTAKLRYSYGRSTRPPQLGDRDGIAIADADPRLWPFVAEEQRSEWRQLPNTGLQPEHQQGGEGGIEVYWGNRASLSVTNYNQVIDGLVHNVNLDSVFVSAPGLGFVQQLLYFANFDPVAGTGWMWQQIYANVGTIRNRGWEATGRLTMGPVTFNGTYSYTRSRLIGIAPMWEGRYLQNIDGLYTVGSKFSYMAEHTWAVNIRYALNRTSVGLYLNGVGQTDREQPEIYWDGLATSLRLRNDRWRVKGLEGYSTVDAGYTMANLTMDHILNRWVTVLVNITNLTNMYRNDILTTGAVMGRNTRVGFRVRL